MERDKEVKELCLALRGWMMTGLSSKEAMEKAGLTAYRYQKLRKSHPEIDEALSYSKEMADGMLIGAAISLAKGYFVTEKVPVKMKKATFEGGKKVSETEEAQIVESEKYIPPNATLLTFLLKTRLPESYGEKLQEVENSHIILHHRVPRPEEEEEIPFGDRATL